jgi:hypothetical protein
MPLSVGDKLGPYEILALLGAGVMGVISVRGDFRSQPSVAELEVTPALL